MDEEYKVKHIPPNFENGVNILGLNFRAIYLIEGLILGILAGIGSFFFLKNLIGMSDIGQTAGLSLAAGGILAFVGIRGLNDEPISTFLLNLVRFVKNKRTTYYNPRVKKEAVSFTEERENNPAAEAIPRERILALIEEMKEKHPGKTYVDDSFFNPDLMQFEEDKLLEELKKAQEKERRKEEKRK